MNFSTAIATCFANYATFKGRASRSEYWWFYLFNVLMGWGATLVDAALGDGYVSALIAGLVFFIPGLAAGSRRLHDTGRSGWRQLLMLTVIGFIPLVIWWAAETKKETNKYGGYAPA